MKKSWEMAMEEVEKKIKNNKFTNTQKNMLETIRMLREEMTHKTNIMTKKKHLKGERT